MSYTAYNAKGQGSGRLIANAAAWVVSGSNSTVIRVAAGNSYLDALAVTMAQQVLLILLCFWLLSSLTNVFRPLCNCRTPLAIKGCQCDPAPRLSRWTASTC